MCEKEVIALLQTNQRSVSVSELSFPPPLFQGIKRNFIVQVVRNDFFGQITDVKL
jgi:hypothetical protein